MKVEDLIPYINNPRNNENAIDKVASSIQEFGFKVPIVVDKNNVILSTGYNGFPYGCSDDEFPWDRDGDDTKYKYVVHAELNAILNSRGKSLTGAKLYVDLFPCNECAKAIIQSGVGEVVYLYDKYAHTAETQASKRMLTAAGVKFKQLVTDKKKIELDFER